MFSQPSPLGKHCARSLKRDQRSWLATSIKALFSTRRKGPGRRFADVLKLLDEASLVSAWHAQPVRLTVMKAKRPCIGDVQESSGFHIHYVFSPPKSLALRSVKLGAYNEYVAEKISDHVPLAVDLDF